MVNDLPDDVREIVDKMKDGLKSGSPFSSLLFSAKERVVFALYIEMLEKQDAEIRPAYIAKMREVIDYAGKGKE
jgi:hypothetical protein